MADLRFIEASVAPPSGIERLCIEAAMEGFRFLDRLVTEWNDGRNRFDREGECLLGAYDDSGLIAIGGLNRDPYTDRAEIGRIRRFYVLNAARRLGLGRSMIEEILQHARKFFHEVRLTTDTLSSADFYRACGFVQIDEPTASHSLVLWSEGRQNAGSSPAMTL